MKTGSEKKDNKFCNKFGSLKNYIYICRIIIKNNEKSIAYT